MLQQQKKFTIIYSYLKKKTYEIIRNQEAKLVENNNEEIANAVDCSKNCERQSRTIVLQGYR